MAKKSIVLLRMKKSITVKKKSGKDQTLLGALASDKISQLGSWRIAADDNNSCISAEGMQQYKK
jgi:beta-glucosidase